MIRFIRHCKDNERGATAIEYGLLAALLVLSVVGAISGALNASKTMWHKIDTEVTAATN